ncbi:MAG: glycosyltransferase family 2 protein [Candidatus Omnitrophica bacterium]|nr:glycosyltransferase family 2 protein [Candidatus Omnitrophota bacterium]
MKKSTISAVLITKNEERNIKRCLDSLHGWVDEIVVIDGESTDRTREIALTYGARVVIHPFTGDFGMERNIGNDSATSEWILALDADEVIPEKTREKIEHILRTGAEFDAYNVPRLQYFLGRPLLHGGRYHSIVNFFRKGKARFDGKVHHLVHVNGKTGQFNYPIEHHPFQTVSEFVQKQDRYTRYEALEILEKFGDSRLREVRHNLTMKPIKMFIKSYFKKKGFKDGLAGLIFCILFSWRHFLKWAKYWELCEKKKEGRE